MCIDTDGVTTCPASYLRVLKETAYFHDWYLKDIYIANTGKTIHNGSKRGYTTLQIELCTSNNDISYLLIFSDVSAMKILMERSEDVSVYSFTSFGRCYQYSIESHQHNEIHVLTFEGGACISLTPGKVRCKKIVNNFFG